MSLLKLGSALVRNARAAGVIHAVGNQVAKAGVAASLRSYAALPELPDNASPVRHLFFGNVTKAGHVAIPFPMPLDDDARETLDALVEPVQSYFKNEIDHKEIDVTGKIPDDTMAGLKDLGLFGLQIPEKYGGLELSNSAYARMVECLTDDPSIAVTLLAHQSIGLKGILIFGTEEQKQKYLPKLASGENVAAFALTEPTAGSDAAGIKTRATLSEDGKHFILNGNKIWISNGGTAEVFTVFARTEVTNDKGEKEDKVTAFIVERSFGGIKSGSPEDKLGIRGSNTTQLYFDDCKVPVENVLGEVGGGFKVAMQILNNGRFGLCCGAAGGIKKVIGMIAEFANQREQFGTPISQFGMIKEKFARMEMLGYVSESMGYMSAALIDNKCYPDGAVEAAIAKIYGSEAMWYAVNEALQIMGGSGFIKDFPYERMVRDTRILMIFEGTNEILRLFVALNGMKASGERLKGLQKAMKGGDVGTLMTEGLTRLRRRFLYPEQLEGVVSPLRECAGQFEKHAAVFQHNIEAILKIHGKKVVDQQLLLKRVADQAIDLYGMLCVISRATRTSKANGPTAKHEARLCNLYCAEANNRLFQNTLFIRQNLSGMHPGGADNYDTQIRRIADEVLDKQSYIPAHPLSFKQEQ
eukprot:CAMPEP_0113876012 /NCGR_PEP_ID=MMETSP0780_2-20120614/5252_1 /TAXON_ID=652834 /ORGANISM="Palpitomonas bilix" /LENGTH=639 /DNA_ID=CAMNT_0000862047 /DNA_START=126 /DNA_END=2045 /DNA_ORIENTATION=+ /assembly_acc=CAM_ASM_000599